MDYSNVPELITAYVDRAELKTPTVLSSAVDLKTEEFDRCCRNSAPIKRYNKS